MTEDLYAYLSKREYPGRGIAIGRTPCSHKMRIAYWIMGRSENSRNRIFVKTEDGIRTEAYDPTKMQDPALIIYAPVRVYKDLTVVTNGDQTDTIVDYLKEDRSFVEALETRTYEPDGPNYTPRISAVVHGADYEMSILKKDEDETVREFFMYKDSNPGYGHLITTYQDNGDPLPSFAGEPVKWEMVHEPFEMFSEHVWEALNHENRVSLFTRQINIETGETQTKIYNRNKEEGHVE